MTRYSAIVALTERNGMGMNGKIPWRVPEDFKYFKGFTMGKTCVMGRKTYEDLLTYAKNVYDPLPGRKLVVLTSGKLIGSENVKIITDMRQVSDETGDVCFIGGAGIYAQSALMFNDILLSVTRLRFEHEVECDTFFNPQHHGFKLFDYFRLSDNLPHTVELYTNGPEL